MTEVTSESFTQVMALRVLLADESISIKKVIQLSLQDFGVEVKSVPVGLDVASALESFDPDIVFIDILLTKKSGYEVAREIKTGRKTAHIPVVLMWSGFMELDGKKSAEAKADGQLEKPFDADQLRTLVKKLVPKLSSNAISSYLQFPPRPEFEADETQSQEESSQSEAPVGLNSNSMAPSFHDLSAVEEVTQDNPIEVKQEKPVLPFLNDLEDPEDFQQVPLPRARSKQPLTEQDDESWMESKLSDFIVELPENMETAPADTDITSTSIAISGGETEIMLMDVDKEDWAERTHTQFRPQTNPEKTAATTVTPKKAPQPAPQAPIAPSSQSEYRGISSDKIEAIVREEVRAQTQQVLEDIAWKVIPELAERIIREELDKLLKESEDLAR